MAQLHATWQEGVRNLLESHGVLDNVIDTLGWAHPKFSLFLFSSGIAVYVVNQVLGVGLMMILGTIAIFQILFYRFLKMLQDNHILFSGVNLKENFVVTPQPETVSIGVKVIGDCLRLVEEKTKDLAVSKNYVEIMQALMFLILLSAVGRVFALPEIMVGLWVTAFSVLPIYGINEEFFDGILDSLHQVMQMVV